MSNDIDKEAAIDALANDLADPIIEALSRDVIELMAERDLSRRIVCEPTAQTAGDVKVLGNKTAAACRVIDLFNLKSSHEAWIRSGRELRAEVAKLRQALEGLLKHAASKAFWEQQSVDHWDKPGPHNATVKALRAIAVAEAALAPATPGEGGVA